jgi:pyridoxine kinase
MSKDTLKVLSIQSHVAYGYAGNKAAVFPMQKLGVEVSPIYTVQLSNHTQYDVFKGAFFSAYDIRSIIDGMRANNFLHKHDAILSGYIGDISVAKVIADTVIDLKSYNPKALYCCDPVFGDIYDHHDEGHIFASKDHPKMFLEHLLPIADIITPNLFELATLSDITIQNYSDITKACDALIQKTGNKNQIIIVTSTSFDKTKTGIAAYKNGKLKYLESTKYNVKPKVSGSGDITAAMFLCYILKGKQLSTALKNITACLDGIFKTTYELDTDELALIQAQKFIR